MPSKKTQANNNKPQFLNFELTENQAQRFNEYMIKVATKKGKIQTSLRSQIGRMALQEWLDKHENDLELF